MAPAIISLAENHLEWAKDYEYIGANNEFVHKSVKEDSRQDKEVKSWFDL